MKARSVVAMTFCVAVWLLCVPPGVFSGPAEEAAGVDAALAWLALVDAGQYAQSWDKAASLFRSAVTKDQWVSSLKGVRQPLGGAISRTAAAKQYTRSVPGAPDGEYVVIQFNTSFANKKSAVETVTPMRDKDGTWRVSGYYIR
jgi:hypothetical protein